MSSQQLIYYCVLWHCMNIHYVMHYFMDNWNQVIEKTAVTNITECYDTLLNASCSASFHSPPKVVKTATKLKYQC